MRVLVVTAVAAESDSVTAGLDGYAASAPRVLASGRTVTRLHRPAPGPRAAGPPARHAPEASGAAPVILGAAPDGAVVDVVAGGVGPAAAAVAATSALAAAPYAYDLVVSTGIGGGFPPHAPLGAVVVSDAIVAADLGADTPEGYVAVEELGFGRSVHLPPPGLTGRIAEALHEGGQRHVVAPVLTASTVTGTAARTAELIARHPRAGAEAMEGFGVAEAATAHGVPVVELRAVSNTVGPRDRAAWRIGEALESLRRTFQLLGTTVFLEDL
ncbi:futalosine hydrolase [Streptomyces sp. NPDC000229]|uniref:futalosine hydrolase n=1 Tax=Streptomyces sp. NPDC000229 TaxID=3154247 RepID=UPI00331CA77C